MTPILANIQMTDHLGVKMENIYEKARLQILKDLRVGLTFPVAEGDLTPTQRAKIEAHAKRFGHSVSEVTRIVLENEVAYFAIVGKNPGRMDYYEDALVKFLSLQAQVARAIKLPKSGPRAKHIWRGEVHTGGGRRGDVKSLDIEVEFKNSALVYVVHKFTQEGGGAQDNQYREAKGALAQVRLPSGKVKVNLAAVLDGDYYLRPSAKGISKLQATQLEHTDAVVCTYQTFIEETKSIWERR
jgi:hypothetical protein